MKTHGDEREKIMVSVCATAIVNLFAIKQRLLVWWLLALLGVRGQGANGGKGKRYELKF